MNKIIVPVVFFTLIFLCNAFVESSKMSAPGSGKLEDSLALDRAKYVKLVLESIKGKENLESDSVYTNIKLLNKVPAQVLLKIMEMGYSKSLGVSCGHCHNTSDFASDKKPEKDITRQMVEMNAEINKVLLKKINGLTNPNPIINCTTCHRGQIKPALNLGN